MAREYVFSLADLDRWRDFYSNLNDPGPYHSPEYVDLITGRLGAETDATLYILESDEEFVYYPFLSRPIADLPFADRLPFNDDEVHDIVASWYYGGPIASSPEASVVGDFLHRFSAFCRANDIVAEFVRFDPNVNNNALFPELDSNFERETVWVDLTRSRDEIWNDFEKRNRNAIRQAQDTELVVEPTDDSDDIADFYEIYTNAMEAKDASDHYRFDRSFFEQLLDRSSLASLLVARFDETVVGGSVIVHDTTLAHDYLRASNPDYWDLRVNNLICYEALMHMKSTGRRRFDFQGGRPGVFKFKKSFSPHRGEFHIAERIHQPDRYETLVSIAETTGIEVDSGYFPTYRYDMSN